jgi:hypothetical protein
MDTMISRDTSNSKNTLNSRKASNNRTASNSMIERNSRNPNNTLATPGTSTIAERPATGNHQELKDASNSKNACLWLDLGNSSDTSNKRQQQTTLRMTAIS